MTPQTSPKSYKNDPQTSPKSCKNDPQTSLKSNKNDRQTSPTNDQNESQTSHDYKSGFDSVFHSKILIVRSNLAFPFSL